MLVLPISIARSICLVSIFQRKHVASNNSLTLSSVVLYNKGAVSIYAFGGARS